MHYFHSDEYSSFFLFQTNEWVHFGEYKAVWLSKRIKCDTRKDY